MSYPHETMARLRDQAGDLLPRGAWLGKEERYLTIGRTAVFDVVGEVERRTGDLYCIEPSGYYWGSFDDDMDPDGKPKTNESLSFTTLAGRGYLAIVKTDLIIEEDLHRPDGFPITYTFKSPGIFKMKNDGRNQQFLFVHIQNPERPKAYTGYRS